MVTETLESDGEAGILVNDVSEDEKRTLEALKRDEGDEEQVAIYMTVCCVPETVRFLETLEEEAVLEREMKRNGGGAC